MAPSRMQGEAQGNLSANSTAQGDWSLEKAKCERGLDQARPAKWCAAGRSTDRWAMGRREAVGPTCCAQQVAHLLSPHCLALRVCLQLQLVLIIRSDFHLRRLMIKGIFSLCLSAVLAFSWFNHSIFFLTPGRGVVSGRRTTEVANAMALWVAEEGEGLTQHEIFVSSASESSWKWKARDGVGKFLEAHPEKNLRREQSSSQYLAPLPPYQ